MARLLQFPQTTEGSAFVFVVPGRRALLDLPNPVEVRNGGPIGTGVVVPGNGIVSRASLVWAAQQVVRQHHEPASEDRETGRCAQCGDEGCQLLWWAMTLLRIEP